MEGLESTREHTALIGNRIIMNKIITIYDAPLEGDAFRLAYMYPDNIGALFTMNPKAQKTARKHATTTINHLPITRYRANQRANFEQKHLELQKQA